MGTPVDVNDVLDGHVVLDVDCVDGTYLNAYVPNLQVGGQVECFCDHLGQPIASPAVIQRIGNRFRRDVKDFARRRAIPVLHLKKPDRSRWDDRKVDHVRPHLERAERRGRFGLVAIVVAPARDPAGGPLGAAVGEHSLTADRVDPVRRRILVDRQVIETNQAVGASAFPAHRTSSDALV